MPQVSITSPKRGPVLRPDFVFMRGKLSRWIGFGLGSGLSSVAPGTVGTLLAWAGWLLAAPLLTELQAGAIIGAAFLLGVWACGRVASDLGVADHGAIVWDEIVAFWLVLLMVPGGFGSQFSAFLLFRFFDIVKPPPIRWADRRLKNGFGVMFDDLLAAIFTLVVMAIWNS
jgi:phosphatidylglycerophosphatase A